jgi:DNA repair exonuclease SbcCD ATPase subunit
MPASTDSVDTADQRLTVVQHLWQENNASVVVGPLSADHVAAIMLLLIEHGVPPTVRAVRHVFGSGSPNAITKWVRETWEAGHLTQRLATRASGAEIPAEVLQLWDVLTTRAVTAARVQTAQDREALDAQRAAMDALAESMNQRERVLDERVAGVQAQMAMQDIALRELRDSLTGKSNELETLRSETSVRTEALHNQNSELTRQYDLAQAQIQALSIERGISSQAIATQQQQLEDLRRELQQARDACEQATQRAQATLKSKIDMEMALHEAKAKCASLEEAQANAAQVRQQADALRHDLDEAHRSMSLLRSDNATIRSALTQAENALSARDWIEGELEQTRQRLATAIRERDQILRHPPALVGHLAAIEATLQQMVSGHGAPGSSTASPS